MMSAKQDYYVWRTRKRLTEAKYFIAGGWWDIPYVLYLPFPYLYAEGKYPWLDENAEAVLKLIGDDDGV